MEFSIVLGKYLNVLHMQSDTLDFKVWDQFAQHSVYLYILRMN